MNETIVKTEKLTELKNLVSEIEDFNYKYLLEKNQENEISIKNTILLKTIDIFTLIKTL